MKRVGERLRERFAALRARAIVSSAACGADLLALDAAGDLGIQRTIVLPFDPVEFRKISVVDRGEEWGTSYDRILREVAAEGGLVVIGDTERGNAAYARVNEAILDRSASLATDSRFVRALVVWDGVSRGPDDLTVQFAESARRRGMRLEEIRTDR